MTEPAEDAVAQLASTRDPASTVDLTLSMPATASSLSAARRRVQGWLDVQGWPVDEAYDVLLAVNEALANVVDHAYPPDTVGSASVHAWSTADPETGTRRLVVTVIDRGRWAAYHPASPAPELRGRGLALMRAVLAELHVQPSAAGTTVIMVSTPGSGRRPPRHHPSLNLASADG